jgi:hypothetical protein
VNARVAGRKSTWLPTGSWLLSPAVGQNRGEISLGQEARFRTNSGRGWHVLISSQS